MEMVQSLERVSRPKFSTRDWVRDQIHQRILQGVHPQGSRLHQEQLAKEFDVGRGIVREALMELQRFGLVKVIHNKGIFVTSLNSQNLISIYEVREVHDGLAARLCCQRASDEAIEELRQIAIKNRDLGLQGQIHEAGICDREFHDRIVELSRNDTLIRVIDTYRFALKKIVWKKQLDDSPEKHYLRVFEDHMAILNAIASRNPEEAERMARRHIQISIESDKKAQEQGIAPDDLDLSAFENT
jgi:DNA-binding GntR family transcriptional regulator